MVRVLSPIAAAAMLLLLTFSAAGASAGSVVSAAPTSLSPAQPRIEEVSPVAVISAASLPSTSTADASALIVGLALLAAGGAFITVRRRTP